MTPTAVAATFTASSFVGYDMMVYPATAGNGCNGMPIYVSPAASLTSGNVYLYHQTIKKTSLLNAVTITGTTTVAMTTAGTMAVNFGNHNLNDLGYSLPTDSFVPCHLEVGGTFVETDCRLQLGNMYQSPGVLVKIFINIASGSSISLTISKFSNPATASKIEVVFRYFE